MKLVLINDLPLFSVLADPNEFEETIRAKVEPLCQRLPATTTYVGFNELISTWTDAASGTMAELMLLVGTRPPLLARYLPSEAVAAQRVRLTTSRIHGATGHTDNVRVISSSDPAALWHSSHVLVADDVAMSGATLQAVLGSGLIRADSSVCVRIAYATIPALQTLHAEYPTADIRAGQVLDFAPVTEGTAIFLSSLLFGDLRERPFLSQRELLRPFFGADLSALFELRDSVQGLMLKPPVLHARMAAADDCS